MPYTIPPEEQQEPDDFQAYLDQHSKIVQPAATATAEPPKREAVQPEPSIPMRPQEQPEQDAFQAYLDQHSKIVSPAAQPTVAPTARAAMTALQPAPAAAPEPKVKQDVRALLDDIKTRGLTGTKQLPMTEALGYAPELGLALIADLADFLPSKLRGLRDNAGILARSILGDEAVDEIRKSKLGRMATTGILSDELGPYIENLFDKSGQFKQEVREHLMTEARRKGGTTGLVAANLTLQAQETLRMIGIFRALKIPYGEAPGVKGTLITAAARAMISTATSEGFKSPKDMLFAAAISAAYMATPALSAHLKGIAAPAADVLLNAGITTLQWDKMKRESIEEATANGDPDDWQAYMWVKAVSAYGSDVVFGIFTKSFPKQRGVFRDAEKAVNALMKKSPNIIQRISGELPSEARVVEGVEEAARPQPRVEPTELPAAEVPEPTAADVDVETGRPPMTEAERATALTPEGRVPEAAPAQKPADAPREAEPVKTPAQETVKAELPSEERLVDVPVVEVRDSEIAVLPDLMQFRSGGDPVTGVTKQDRIESEKWDDGKAGNLLLWEPTNPAAHGLKPGQKYIVANGHHRLEYGRRQGRRGYNVQIVKESEGWTVTDARIYAAEANIADGKGDIYDQVRLLRNVSQTKGEAEARERAGKIGSRGARAANIANQAADRKGEPGESNLIDAFFNEAISSEQAEAIALGAPKNEAWQDQGIKWAQGEKMDPTRLRMRLAAGQRLLREQGIDINAKATQGVLFGNDDPAMIEADAVARVLVERTTELKRLKNALVAGKRLGADAKKELVKQHGIDVDVKDKDALKKAISDIDEKLFAYEHGGEGDAIVDDLRQEAVKRGYLEVKSEPEAVKTVVEAKTEAGGQPEGVIKAPEPASAPKPVTEDMLARLNPEQRKAYDKLLAERGQDTATKYAEQELAREQDLIEMPFGLERETVKDETHTPPKEKPPETRDMFEDISLSSRPASDESPRGIDAEPARILADEFTRNWKNKPDGGIEVIQSERDLDYLGLNDDAVQAIRERRAEAFYHIPSKTVYVIADNLSRPSDVMRVALHEAIGHFGVRTVLGDRLDVELDRLGKLIPADELREIASQYDKNLDNPQQRLDAIEEYIATRAPTRNPTLWQKFVQAVRGVLKGMGISDEILNDWDTRGDIERLLDAARDYVERGATPPKAEVETPAMRAKEIIPSQFPVTSLTRPQLERMSTLQGLNDEARRQREVMLSASKKTDEEETPRMKEHKFSARTWGQYMTPQLRNVMEERLYEPTTNKRQISEAITRIESDPEKAHVEIFVPEKRTTIDEQTVMAQVLVRMHDMAAKEALDKGDTEAYEQHFEWASKIAIHLNDNLALQSGRAVQSFKIFDGLLDTARNAGRFFERRIVGKFVDLVMERDAKDIADVKKIAVEENTKAVDEALFDAQVQERMSAVLHRLGVEAGKKVDKAMSNNNWRNAVESLEQKEPVDFRFAISKAAQELDDKIFQAAKIGGILMVKGKNTSFDFFKKAIIERVGPNVEPHLQRVYDEAMIWMSNIPVPGAERAPVAGGKEPKAPAAPKGPPMRTVQAALKDALRNWFKNDPNADREPILDLLKAAGLSEAESEALFKTVQQKFLDKAQRAKERRIKQLLGGRMVNATTRRGLARMLELSNFVPLDDANIRGALTTAYGLPTMTPELYKQLDGFAEKIRKAPAGMLKDDATLDLMDFMGRQMPVDAADIGWAVWYGNILSGYQTQERNFMGNVWNVLDSVAASSIAEPKNAAFAWWGLVRGVGQGVPGMINTLKTGRSPLKRSEKFGPAATLELGQKGKFLWVPLKVWQNWKYVTRLMEGIDILFFKGAEEARASMIAANMVRAEGVKDSAELWSRVAQVMGTTTVQQRAYMREAEAQGLTGSKAKVYAQSRMEQDRAMQSPEWVKESQEYGKYSTFHMPVEGVAGMLTKAIEDLGKKNKLPQIRFIVPFTKIVANVYNTSIDHTPWGYIRTIKGMRDSKGNLQPITGHRRAQLVAKATMGSIAMITAMYLDIINSDDDDPFFAIYANGPRNYNKQNQLRETGWIPYSFKIGKTYFDYRLTPMLIPFAIIGALRDAARYEKLEEQTMWDRLSYAMLKSLDVMSNMSFLSGMNEITKLMEGTPGSSGTKLQKYLTSLGSTAMPALFKQIDRIFDPSMRDNATIREGLLREVPIASRIANPKLNAVGEPIKQTTGPVSIFFSKERSDPVWRFVVENDAYISDPRLNKKIGYGKLERHMTEDEFYEYVKESGALIKRGIERIMTRREGRAKERIKDEVSQIVSDARERVRRKMSFKSARSASLEVEAEVDAPAQPEALDAFHARFDRLKSVTNPDSLTGARFSEKEIRAALEQSPETGNNAHFQDMSPTQQNAALDVLDALYEKNRPPNASETAAAEIQKLPPDQAQLRSLRVAAARGNLTPLDNALERREITRDQYTQIQKDALVQNKYGMLFSDVLMLDVRPAIAVYQAATPSEQKAIRSVVLRKIRDADNFSDSRKREIIKSIGPAFE